MYGIEPHIVRDYRTAGRLTELRSEIESAMAEIRDCFSPWIGRWQATQLARRSVPDVIAAAMHVQLVCTPEEFPKYRDTLLASFDQIPDRFPASASAGARLRCRVEKILPLTPH